MKPYFPCLRRALCYAAACVPLWIGAVPIDAGAPWSMLELSDQHDKPVRISPATRLVIFAAENPVSDLVTRVLGAQGSTTLERAGAVYVADISAMPSIVTRVFALPKLRELPFQIGLVRETAAVADLPRRPGTATVLTLKDGQVTQVLYAQTEAELRQALGLAP
jgi:hypothetical protein